MNFAHIADTHINSSRRIEDTEDVLLQFVEDISAAKVDLVVHAGDLYDRRSDIAERELASRWVQMVTEQCPLVIVRGNHDAVGDLTILRRLKTVHRVYVYERPTLTLDECPVVAGARICAVPWFDKSSIVQQMGIEDQQDGTSVANAAAKAMLTAIRTNIVEASPEPVILVGHCMVAGSRMSTGQVMIGRTVEFGSEALAEVGSTYVALGHIHKRQAWGDVHYSGSTERMNFGEPEEKSWNHVRIQDNRAEVNPILLPARDIVLVDDYEPGDDLTVPRGALVRVRLSVPSSKADQVDREAIIKQAIRAGASDCKVEVAVQTEQRIRSVEMSKATSLHDRLRVYWKATGDDTDKEGCLSKLDELLSEGVTHAAA